MTTVSPPAGAPNDGLMPVIVGAAEATYVNCIAAVPDCRSGSMTTTLTAPAACGGVTTPRNESFDRRHRRRRAAELHDGAGAEVAAVDGHIGAADCRARQRAQARDDGRRRVVGVGELRRGARARARLPVGVGDGDVDGGRRPALRAASTRWPSWNSALGSPSAQRNRTEPRRSQSATSTRSSCR